MSDNRNETPTMKEQHKNTDEDVAEKKKQDAVDMIISAATALNHLFRCNPCNRYLLKQLDFEQNCANSSTELQVYQTFFMDDD